MVGINDLGGLFQPEQLFDSDPITAQASAASLSSSRPSERSQVLWNADGGQQIQKEDRSPGRCKITLPGQGETSCGQLADPSDAKQRIQGVSSKQRSCSRVSPLSCDQARSCLIPGCFDLLQQDSPLLQGESGHSWILGFTPREKENKQTKAHVAGSRS